jgi:flagellar hook assembly protein FlgD
MQLQAMQGASLVGRDVIVAGNKLSIDAEAGVGQGGFELANAADAVKVEILARAAPSCRRSTSAPKAPACTASTGPRARRRAAAA